ncbi:RuBisCO large subunit C-terminal-like domain-containing protein [Rhodoplanes sp. TEM]|uniref:RuBisCO large subunit C-terminal-like domain-containing protein n=1 Tax=Rhodoplanes tepidamans TaxID=200616 RepID=A0ABT5J430_RHOTP|nr:MULTISPECIES: RuBisCO large subunit C-terminal-like domain-containing protein [Rhodoplanes]MDC7784409.1 RuBisCO large subunit C-terminal-like domain-containing protein [Rhodoplanes tepidamans]MDC7984104.1 RuBisCO large subunit C-terminal-like domain-containing protein [Rhodoplanes sp. TEM]
MSGVRRLEVTYLIRAAPADIESRAQALAIEQSVEMPLSAITEPAVIDTIVGRVEAIVPADAGRFAVTIGLAEATVGADAGQLLSMLFGNSSLHDDVELLDVALPAATAAAFGGPHHGIAGLRARLGVHGRALTATALKPQGLPAAALAGLARHFAEGGIDLIKDDHGIADQPAAPFAERVPRIAAAVRDAGARTGHTPLYVPNLSGDLDRMRTQVACARAAGVRAVMVAPMVAGFANVHTLIAENPDLLVVTHPALGGASRIAPPLLFGRLFRLIGADAVVYPNYGGRFGYTTVTCRALADAARAPWHGLAASLPVPAGGMTRERVPELLDFYGADVMLLIGGALLEARETLAAATADFVAAVHGHDYMG